MRSMSNFKRHCEESRRDDEAIQNLRLLRPHLERRLAMTALFAVLCFSSIIPFAHATDSLEDILGRVPVQQGGRVKPFSGFARESLLFVTGKASLENQDATSVIWRWVAEPDVWSAKPILPVTNLELRKQFSSDLVRNRIAPALVLNDMDFKKLVGAAQVKQEKEKSISPLEKKQIELYHRARLFEEIANGRMPGFVPHPEDPKIAWLPLEALLSKEGIRIAAKLYPEAEVKQASSELDFLLSRLRENVIARSPEGTTKQSRPEIASATLGAPPRNDGSLAAQSFARSLKNLLFSRDIILDERPINYEILYLKLHPFKLAGIFYLVSVLIWIAPKQSKNVALAAFAIFVSGFLIHTFGFVLRILIAGRPPVTNMYESIIWVAWGSALFSLIFWLFYRSSLPPAIAASVATFGLLVGESFPTFLDPAISPLVPVLRSNYWLTIHVLTITLGYAAFLFNWGIAHALLYASAFNRKKELIENLTEYLYRSLQVGVILLSAGTILGGVWAAESWGRFWGWDPKETWALIAILAYLAVMHSRTAGWLDSFGVAFWCAISFLTVLMAWYGVNFVLGAGLHSYGFGGGGLQYVLVFVLTDVFFVLWLSKRFNAKPSHR